MPNCICAFETWSVFGEEDLGPRPQLNTLSLGVRSHGVGVMNLMSSGRICDLQVECRLDLCCIISDLYIGGGNSEAM